EQFAPGGERDDGRLEAVLLPRLLRPGVETDEVRATDGLLVGHRFPFQSAVFRRETARVGRRCHLIAHASIIRKNTGGQPDVFTSRSFRARRSSRATPSSPRSSTAWLWACC